MTQALNKPVKPNVEESLLSIVLDEIPRATRAFFAPIIGARIVIRDLIAERREREQASHPSSGDRAA